MSKKEEAVNMATTIKRYERDEIRRLGEGNLASGIRSLLKVRASLVEILESDVLCDEPGSVDHTGLVLLKSFGYLLEEKKRPA